MDEFVSKKLLVAKFNELASKYIDGDKRQRGLAYTTAADMIALADAADVQPVRHGRWIGEEVIQCSNCNFTLNGTSYGRIVHKYFSYCPNCSAKMIKDGDTE